MELIIRRVRGEEGITEITPKLRRQEMLFGATIYHAGDRCWEVDAYSEGEHLGWREFRTRKAAIAWAQEKADEIESELLYGYIRVR